MPGHRRDFEPTLTVCGYRGREDAVWKRFARPHPSWAPEQVAAYLAGYRWAHRQMLSRLWPCGCDPGDTEASDAGCPQHPDGTRPELPLPVLGPGSASPAAELRAGIFPPILGAGSATPAPRRGSA